MAKGTVGFGGALDLQRFSGRRHPHTARSIRLPGGRLILTRDRGDSCLLGQHQFITNTRLVHRGGDGKVKDIRDLGSGLVTNAGVNLMSNDFGWTNCTLKQANYHAIGTGATAAAASDVWLQTAQGATNLSGTTNGYMTGTQSIIANATSTPFSPVYQTVATFTATGSIAVTEWILAIGNGANIAGTATATSSTSLTTTGLTSNAQAMWTVEAVASTPSNTSSTPMLQIASNTTTVVTGLDSSWASGTKTWLTAANGAVATPSGTTSYVMFPTAWDHKVFAAVNLASTDTLQITYQLSINSGG